jgi:hypothetical protein
MLKSPQFFLILMALLCAAPFAAQARSKKQEQEAQFVIFLRELPGDYDNLTQTENEADAHHAGIVLSVKPLNVQTLGKLVMFARETVADDPRRVLSQRIWIIEHDKQNQIVQKVYLFKEPQRWIHAGDDPLLMQSLLPDDLTALSGCELYWVKTDTGFSGDVRPHSCRPASSSEGQLIETSAELRNDELTMTELQAGSGGRLPAQSTADSSLHFQRRGG